MDNKEEMQEEKKSKTEKFASFLHKSADLGKKIAKTAVDTTTTTVEKIKDKNEQYKKEKLNPLSHKEYKSKSFNLPNVIKIVDDAERRDIPVCEGAIGWRATENNTEILYLYDEAKDISGLEFIPTFQCNAVYCVYPFDHKKFIKADCIFSKTHEEKLAELENIAYCLGAKSCSIEIVTSEETGNKSKTSISLGFNKVGIATEQNQAQSMLQRNAGKTVVAFKGHDNPTRPTLKWFAYDDTIKNLIEMRCNQPDSLKSRTLELSGASSATMSRQTAIAIDMVLKKQKVSANNKMEAQSTKELNNKLLFDIEF